MKTKLKIKQEKGITLIALVVTIVVLLILAGVSISLVLNNNGVISKAKDSKNSTERGQAQDEVNLAINYLQIEDATSTLTQEDRRKILEDELRKISADSSVSISGDGFKIIHKKYEFFVDEDLNVSDSEKKFDATEWDKKAAPEDIFIWKSDDPNNADYGVVIGYKKNVDNYTILRFPSRCTKVTNDWNVIYSDIYHDTGDDQKTIRSYTKNILKVELPDTVKELGEAAFGVSDQAAFDFSSLERIELSKGLSKIEAYAFYNCEKLKYVKMSDNITEIGSYAFYGCKALESITIPEGVKEIGNEGFSCCENLRNVNLQEGLEKIGTAAFKSCTNLQQINIPEGVNEIGDRCFSDCEKLQQVNLPEGLIKIGFSAFELAKDKFTGRT
jgi:type II secretory pathway pseudopilin PulG